MPKIWKNGSISMHLWLFGEQKFMFFYALMIHESRNDDVFLLNSKSTFLNYSKLLKDLDSTLTRPKSKSGIFTENGRITMRTYVSLIVDLGKIPSPNSQNCDLCHENWTGGSSWATSMLVTDVGDECVGDNCEMLVTVLTVSVTNNSIF